MYGSFQFFGLYMPRRFFRISFIGVIFDACEPVRRCLWGKTNRQSVLCLCESASRKMARLFVSQRNDGSRVVIASTLVCNGLPDRRAHPMCDDVVSACRHWFWWHRQSTGFALSAKGMKKVSHV